MSSLINKAACKKVVLEFAQTRAHKFTRVGSDVYDHLNDLVLNSIKGIIRSHPSIGKTIMMGSKSRKKENADDLKL
jgi:hypothetical protein